MTLHISDAEVRRLIALEPLIGAVRAALIDLSAGRVVQPLRTVIEIASEDGLLFVKPVLARDILATKLIAQLPRNAGRGLPTMQATIVLMDAITGRTLAVLDATSLSALRTAAVSAVAVDCLSTPEPKVVALLGSGALARTHASALRAVRPVCELRVWSRDPGNVSRCCLEVDGVAASTAEDAVRGADIVCTITNAREPVLMGRWLKPGALVCAVGAPRPGWRELDDEAMANVIIADSREAAMQESGDVILSRATIAAEIGEILAGTRPRPPVRATVVFKPLGQAVTDAIAARLVYDAACKV
jgi:ornithine cyclodeaminase/alanine dehydrogenase-like protein (mu-crystallin family)